MCGIVGAVSLNPVAETLIRGLERLEYRGYDSAGIAIFDDQNEEIFRLRKPGPVSELKAHINGIPKNGTTGISHTRRATHGPPNETNAHPHVSERIFLVHDGIIENYQDLKSGLKKDGYVFETDTDSEVIVHLIHKNKKLKNCSLLEAVSVSVRALEGTYALGVISRDEPEKIIAARKDSPLVLAQNDKSVFLASDQLALADEAETFWFLDDEEIAELSLGAIKIFDLSLETQDRECVKMKLSGDQPLKGGHDHYMKKEILEQPDSLTRVLERGFRGDEVSSEVFGSDASEIFSQVKSVQIIACGTSFHAGLIAKNWIEEFSNLPCSVDIASEYLYRRAVISNGTLFVSISQSGETTDTLACLRDSKRRSFLSRLAICNVPTSSIARESDLNFSTRAGPEIGVASTKGFTTQLMGMLLLSIALGKHNGLGSELEKQIVSDIRQIPEYMHDVMEVEAGVIKIAQELAGKKSAIFLGKGVNYPIALEGALKLKEISYIHAEGYPSGELKHGPLALIDSEMPVIALATNNSLLGKVKSNLEEVKTRGGSITSVVSNSDETISLISDNVIYIPDCPELLQPFLAIVPLQMLAYHITINLGLDPDKPRNLAKSVR